MNVVIRCDALGMDYIEGGYVKQPKWFIELLLRKRQVDAERSKAES